MSDFKERALIYSRSCMMLAITLFNASAVALTDEDQGPGAGASGAVEEVVVVGRF